MNKTAIKYVYILVRWLQRIEALSILILASSVATKSSIDKHRCDPNHPSNFVIRYIEKEDY